MLQSVVSAEPKRDAQPNIVMIMADDIGLECLSCYGSEVYETPNIDRLAASGMRFKHAHAQPICTPSRVQLMTGIYNNRNYIKFGLLDPEAVTFGNVLQDLGYTTCIAGKWQLGGGFEGPRKFGFDRYCLWQLTRRPSRYPNPGLEIDGVERDFKQGEFGPDVVSDYINQFMADHQEEPFFVYYPMIAPHWPFVPTPDHPDWDPTMWRDRKDEPRGDKEKKYWDAMVRHTDKMVGKVLDQIDDLGLSENTLVIWTGDNGTYTEIISKFKGRDYQGGKGSTRDNGTHVGFMARWSGKIPAGEVSEELVDFTDVFPTLLDVAGANANQAMSTGRLSLDGVSLMPTFLGKPRSKSSIYCWYQRDGKRKRASQHTRDARYKLYADGRFFDVQNDLEEEHDISKSLPDSVRGTYLKLKADLNGYLAVTKAADPIQATKRERVTQENR